MDNVSTEIITRGYELDRQSLIPPVVFFRYMEHLRWVSAERGAMDLMQLLSQGYLLVVAGQQLRLHRHVGMGVRLRATMNVCNAGRTSITLTEDFHEGGELVAQGQVAAVLLEPGGAPAPLSSELRALAAEHPAADLCPRLTAPRPAGLSPWTTHVRPDDLDLYNHANQASFLAYIEDARAMAAVRGGLPREGGGAAGKGRA